MNFIDLLNPLTGIKSIIKNRDLLLLLTRRNVASRYKGSALGVLWGGAQPLIMLCVYTFVFSIVLKSRWGIKDGNSEANFAIIMFCGMAIFNVFTESVNGSCALIVGSPNYVKKVIFPLEILPVAHTLSSTIFSLIWFLLLFIGTMMFGGGAWTMLLLPVTIIPLILFSCGICFFISSLTVYIRDITYVIAALTQILFFITPVFYPIDAVPVKYRWILELNPLTFIIEQTRRIFLFGQMPNWGVCLTIFAISLIVFHLGMLWFLKTKKGFADVL